MEPEKTASVPVFLLRSAIIHTLTYFVAGMISSSLFDYRKIFDSPVIREYMLGFGTANVAWGPWLQPIRGLVLGAALLPFRSFLAERRSGWLHVWGLFLCIGILGTPAAAPASMEGLIYTRLPLWYHLVGMPEICLQTLAYSWLLHLYLRHPKGIVRDLPPIFGSLLAAISGACFAFVGYAAVSIAFAFASGAGLANAQDSLNLRTQGLFIAPFLINGALIYAGPRLRPPLAGFLPLLAAAYAANAAAVAAYQAMFLGGANAAYALLAPLLPALVTALVARPKKA